MPTLADVLLRLPGGIPLVHVPRMTGGTSAAEIEVTVPAASEGSRITPAPAGFPRADDWAERSTDAIDCAARRTALAWLGRPIVSRRPNSDAKIPVTTSNSIKVNARRFIW